MYAKGQGKHALYSNTVVFFKEYQNCLLCVDCLDFSQCAQGILEGFTKSIRPSGAKVKVEASW